MGNTLLKPLHAHQIFRQQFGKHREFFCSNSGFDVFCLQRPQLLERSGEFGRFGLQTQAGDSLATDLYFSLRPAMFCISSGSLFSKLSSNSWSFTSLGSGIMNPSIPWIRGGGPNRRIQIGLLRTKEIGLVLRFHAAGGSDSKTIRLFPRRRRNLSKRVTGMRKARPTEPD